MSYSVFKRTARNFEEFSKARKIHIIGNLSYREAQDICKNFNDTRTTRQIKSGTKLEFTKE